MRLLKTRWPYTLADVYGNASPLMLPVDHDLDSIAEARIVDVRPVRRGDSYITSSGTMKVAQTGHGKTVAMTRVIVEVLNVRPADTTLHYGPDKRSQRQQTADLRRQLAAIGDPRYVGVSRG